MSSKKRSISNGQCQNKEDKMNPNKPSPSQRKSPRLSSNGKTTSVVAAAPSVAVKRSICVRKIAPRKTEVPSEANKENKERLSRQIGKKPQISTPTTIPVSAPKPKVLSPILAPMSPPPQPREGAVEEVWSQKVRRSYSRGSLENKSFESPRCQASSSPSGQRRETLFGFDQLQTPEVVRMVNPSREASLVSSSLCGPTFNLSSVDDSAAPEPDLNIPGVVLVKKNTRRKRVQQIKISELDLLAAKMNAEFEEAESFELVVE